MKQRERVIGNQTNSLGNENSDEFNNSSSVFQEIIFAFHRQKQLNQGAHPRIAADSSKRKNTSIAIEEVKQGLITFKNIKEEIAWKI
jgi:DNA-directed RNA polymerase subunit K/omega